MQILFMEGTLRMLAPIRTYEPKIALSGKEVSRPPSIKITNSLMEVSEQVIFKTAVKSQKKWGMALSAQKDRRDRRRVCNSAWTQEKNQDPTNSKTQKPALMMVL